ncbi:hypothetical protein PFI31113_01778 [Pandoraea fibrosis]|uniref:Uncharacterized protein n=1 Tax=Pandoraea fibrosis TaxID=1891094 RepID=A0A5E4U781_9BURK|nr:hypothetical protein PFI31113_01778 [Pandoraea fibrosis]
MAAAESQHTLNVRGGCGAFCAAMQLHHTRRRDCYGDDCKHQPTDEDHNTSP